MCTFLGVAEVGVVSSDTGSANVELVGKMFDEWEKERKKERKKERNVLCL